MSTAECWEVSCLNIWPRLFCILMGEQDRAGVHGKVWALGRPGPPTPHFYRQGLGQPGPPKPSLLSTGPGPAQAPQPLTSIGEPLTFIDRPWARPGPPTPHFYWQTPHFYRQALGQPGPQPLTSIGQTPHFYQPDPSLLSARPGRQLASDPSLSWTDSRKESLSEQNRHRHMF